MAAGQYEVVAVGNAIVDIICRCDDAFLSRTGLPKGRMTIAPSSAAITAIARQVRRGIEVAGGSAANTAVGVASFGARAAFIGKVADDEPGRIFQHDIRGTGVAFTSPATTATGKETSRSLILVTPDGQRTMLTLLGCSSDLDAAYIGPETIRQSRIVYLEGYLLDKPQARVALHRAVSLAKAAGKLVALTLSDPLCVERHRVEFLRLIRAGVGLLFTNEAEIASLYEVSDIAEAVRLVGQDTKLAVVTRSEKGSVIVSEGAPLPVPAEPMRKVVDATGAGDMFAAGFLFGFSRGMGLQRAARLGSLAAAEIISIMGARPEVRLDHIARMRGFLNAAAG